MKATVPFIQDAFSKYNTMCFKGSLPQIQVKLTNARTFLGKVTYVGKRDFFGNGHRVKYYLDKDLLGTQKVSFHPCENTASVVISKDDLLKFLSIWGGEVEWIEV